MSNPKYRRGELIAVKLEGRFAWQRAVLLDPVNEWGWHGDDFASPEHMRTRGANLDRWGNYRAPNIPRHKRRVRRRAMGTRLTGINTGWLVLVDHPSFPSGHEVPDQELIACAALHFTDAHLRILGSDSKLAPDSKRAMEVSRLSLDLVDPKATKPWKQYLLETHTEQEIFDEQQAREDAEAEAKEQARLELVERIRQQLAALGVTFSDRSGDKTDVVEVDDDTVEMSYSVLEQILTGRLG